MTQTIQFEAKKHRYVQAQGGMTVTFIIHPNDPIPPELANAPLGTIYILRLQQTESGAWDEQASGQPALLVCRSGIALTAAPQSGEETAALSKPKGGDANTNGGIQSNRSGTSETDGKSTSPNNASPRADQSDSRGAKPHRDWAELPLSQQCAIRCRDKQFQLWFLGMAYYQHQEDAAEWTARMIREKINGSRKLLDSDSNSAAIWQAINARYEQWLTMQAHGELIR